MDSDDFAGRNVANKFGVNRLKGAGLRGDDISVVKLADNQRAKTPRVAGTD